MTALRWQRVRGPDPRRGPAARLRPAAWHLHPGLRLGRAGRGVAAAARRGICGWRDPRMLRTTDAIAATLGRDGPVRRYLADDGLAGFLGRLQEAHTWVFRCRGRSEEHTSE